MEKIHFPFLTSSDSIRLGPSSGKDPPSFHLGQVLRGKVIEVTDLHHAVIRMEGHDFSVESRIPLKRGMEGFFQVKTVSPQIILKLLQPDEMSLLEAERRLMAFLTTDPSLKDLSERVSLLWKTGREEIAPVVRETMDRLLSLWTSFSPSRSSAIDHGQIQKMIEQSGLFFEHRLGKLIEMGRENQFGRVLSGDVKGLLMQLKGQLESSSPAVHSSSARSFMGGELLESVNHLLRSIESAQLLHSPSLTGIEGKLFLLIPFWIQERLQLVDLHLSLPQAGSERSESGGMSMLFLLHLPEWGRMSIEVRLRGKRLLGRFFFSSEEVTAFFSGAIVELQKRFLQLGFQPEIRVSTQTPEKIVELFLNEMKGSDSSLLNLVV